MFFPPISFFFDPLKNISHSFDIIYGPTKKETISHVRS